MTTQADVYAPLTCAVDAMQAGRDPIGTCSCSAWTGAGGSVTWCRHRGETRLGTLTDQDEQDLADAKHRGHVPV